MKQQGIILLSIVLFSSCATKSHDAYWNQIAENAVEDFIGKTMNITDSLSRISFNTLDSVLLFTEVQPVLKMVTYIDGTCGACLISLNFWQSFMAKVYQKRKDCVFYILVNWPDEINEASNPLLEYKFTYSWYIDKYCSFFSNYEIYDKRLQAVLLNQQNEVLLIGEPSLNPRLGEFYLSTILDYKNREIRM
jgi:hypothetical protein